MSRYIDADALLEKAEQEQRFYGEEYDAMESGYLDEERALVEEAYRTMTDCVALINNAPTVDAVPVTRCAQCKWCDYPVPNSTKYGCRLFDRCVKGDWFCADGERRTDEQQT